MGMRVLIVEDDAVSRTILERSVTKLGHECVVAANGAEAWERFRTSDVKVVISDWMMPEMDGVELCRRVRAAEGDTYTYFILLTSLSDQEHLRVGIDAGADDYLNKPLNLYELVVRLRTAERIASLQHRLSEQKGELERLNSHLFEQARRDPLTQLMNRLQLTEDLEKLLDGVQRYGRRFVVGICDVDAFKQYNDTYGHLAGDETLRVVARAIKNHIRSGDTAYRYGGEEFLVILPEQSLETAVIAMDRLRVSVQQLGLTHSGNPPSGVVTISAGLSLLCPENLRGLDETLKEADDALYRAKTDGRNRVAAYHPQVVNAGS